MLQPHMQTGAAISGKTALQLTELDQAETLGDRILTTVGQREQDPAVVAASAETRHRDVFAVRVCL